MVLDLYLHKIKRKASKLKYQENHTEVAQEYNQRPEVKLRKYKWYLGNKPTKKEADDTYKKFTSEYSGYHKNRTFIRKILVLSHYSNGLLECQCCGEDHIKFLSIDHPNNDGSKHRKQIGKSSGGTFYNWLINNGFPDGYRVQCMNCNLGRSQNGGLCPHEEDIEI